MNNVLNNINDMQQEAQNQIPCGARRWHPVQYGDKNRYAFWSQKVKGEGDATLLETAEGFQKFIVLRATGQKDALVSIGFVSANYHKTMILDTGEPVGDNGFTFSMGMDKSDCDFFVTSKESQIGLELVGYRNADDPELLKIPTY
jgi:hypothetical protein